MSITALDVMDDRFFTLSPGMTVAEAVQVFKDASQKLGRRVFGMMVTDERGRLVGMISMYDILILMRPKHIHIWGEMNDVDITGFIDENHKRSKAILIDDLMTTDVITITPETHLLSIVDLMIRKHVRRLPVLEDSRLIGIVHLSNVFYYLMDR